MRAVGAFGLSNSKGYYRVDTGAGLNLKIKRAIGDIMSLNCDGIEYQEPAKGSQVNSGLGTTNVTATVFGTNYIEIRYPKMKRGLISPFFQFKWISKLHLGYPMRMIQKP